MVWQTIAPLVLTQEERQTLECWARRRTSAPAMALRARIVLACAEGTTNVAVAEQLGIWPQTQALDRTARPYRSCPPPRPGVP